MTLSIGQIPFGLERQPRGLDAAYGLYFGQVVIEVAEAVKRVELLVNGIIEWHIYDIGGGQDLSRKQSYPGECQQCRQSGKFYRSSRQDRTARLKAQRQLQVKKPWPAF